MGFLETQTKESGSSEKPKGTLQKNQLALSNYTIHE